MCPTIVSHGGNPLLALGATGGRRIVNSLTNALAYRIGDGLALDAAVKAPRVHSEGGMTLTTEADYPGVNVLKATGYTVTTGSVGSLVATERHIRTSIVKTSAR
jgi:gamma-glutamyltranspeptidase/glutathione hydrolase